jgi:hypothetical protein
MGWFDVFAKPNNTLARATALLTVMTAIVMLASALRGTMSTCDMAYCNSAGPYLCKSPEMAAPEGAGGTANRAGGYSIAACAEAPAEFDVNNCISMRRRTLLYAAIGRDHDGGICNDH